MAKTKRKFTEEEVIKIIEHCNSKDGGGCQGCPADDGSNDIGCYNNAVKSLLKMYKAKCEELEEWKKSHGKLVDDVLERGTKGYKLSKENEDLKAQMKSIGDLYAESEYARTYYKIQYDATHKLFVKELERTIKLEEALDQMKDCVKNILNMTFMYQIDVKKRYTEKDIVNAVGGALADFRKMVIDELDKKLEVRSE